MKKGSLSFGIRSFQKYSHYSRSWLEVRGYKADDLFTTPCSFLIQKRWGVFVFGEVMIIFVLLPFMRISIIVPIFNEEKLLFQKAHQFSYLSKQAEMIFVDGGSHDRSAEIVQDYGVVVGSAKGRAIQMNQGVDVASGEIITGEHCLACTAGSGSSCQGALT